MTDLTPSDNAPGVGDRRTLRFALADEDGAAIALTKARCTLLQRKPGGAPSDVTAQATQDGDDLALVCDLDTAGVWEWRLVYDDADGTGFVEAEEYRLTVARRRVPEPA